MSLKVNSFESIVRVESYSKAIAVAKLISRYQMLASFLQTFQVCCSMVTAADMPYSKTKLARHFEVVGFFMHSAFTSTIEVRTIDSSFVAKAV